MEEIFGKLTSLVNADLTNFSLKEKLTFYQNLINDVDKLMDKKNIDLDKYKKLLEIKKELLSRKKILEIH